MDLATKPLQNTMSDNELANKLPQGLNGDNVRKSIDQPYFAPGPQL